MDSETRSSGDSMMRNTGGWLAAFAAFVAAMVERSLEEFGDAGAFMVG
jgi:hypothetical protein